MFRQRMCRRGPESYTWDVADIDSASLSLHVVQSLASALPSAVSKYQRFEQVRAPRNDSFGNDCDTLVNICLKGWIHFCIFYSYLLGFMLLIHIYEGKQESLVMRYFTWLFR